MGRIFASQADSTKVTDLKDKKLSDLVAQAAVSGLTWQELALFNWGTKETAEVNRALAETIGCKAVDASDPSNTVLDPDRGPGGTPGVFLPKLWTGAADLPPNKTHTVTLKKRQPPPAVEILKCPRWSPPGKAFALEYRLEGLVARASKVDFEVHVSRYYDEDKNGTRSDCGTQGSAPGTTHVFQRRLLDLTGARAPTAKHSYSAWEGESEATHGVLKKAGSGKTYVTHACAPYSVMLRYYADDADKDTKLLLLPFFPRWDRTKALVDASLVVKWHLAGAGKGKLKAGTLRLVDKDDKLVHEVALDEARIGKKSFDLLNDAPAHKLDKTLVKKEGMPYRVQIQAHSDAAEDKGLAIATMHTAVKAMLYDEVQFVAFNIKPDVTTARDAYLGEDGDVADVGVRVEIMKKAIQTALPAASTKESVLKIFMAPEFYWRGRNGGYVQDHLSSIIPKMREETDLFDYADWLFVFGTAIGYVEHTEKGSPVKYGWQERPIEILAIDGSTSTKIHVEHRNVVKTSDTEELAKYVVAGTALKTWRIKQGPTEDEIAGADADGILTDRCFLRLKSKTLVKGPATILEPLAFVTEVDPGTPTRLKLDAPVCARIPHTVGKAVWKVEQGAAKGDVAKCERVPSSTEFWLTLTAKVPGFKKGPLDIIEPPTVETMNVALVQKGWPAPEPDDKALKAAAIYKEYVSAIDYLGPYMGDHDSWGAPDGSGRMIAYRYTPSTVTDVATLPTEGSRDPLGANPSVVDKSKPVTWKHKEKGTESTVGSEINESGDGGGSVITIDGITFGVEICRDHLLDRLFDFYANDAKSGDPLVQVLLVPSWGATLGGGKVETVPSGLLFNVDGARYDSVARVNDGTWSCDEHPDVSEPSAGGCPHCTPDFIMGCVCGELYYNDPTCPKCGKPSFWAFLCVACKTKHLVAGPPYVAKPTMCKKSSCKKTVFRAFDEKDLKKMGPQYTGTKTTVDLSATSKPWTNYFSAKNDVIVYPAKPVPAAATK